MLERVCECLIDRKEQIVPQLGREGIRGRASGNIHIAFNSSLLKKFTGVMANIRDHVFEGVVLRVDRPDDFVQRMKHLTRRVGDRCNLMANFRGHAVVISAHVFA